MRHATMLVAILAVVPLAAATAQEPPPIKVGCFRLQVRYGTLVIKTNDFENLWQNKTKNISVYDFDDAIEKNLLSYSAEWILNES